MRGDEKGLGGATVDEKRSFILVMVRRDIKATTLQGKGGNLRGREGVRVKQIKAMIRGVPSSSGERLPCRNRNIF